MLHLARGSNRTSGGHQPPTAHIQLQFQRFLWLVSGTLLVLRVPTWRHCCTEVVSVKTRFKKKRNTWGGCMVFQASSSDSLQEEPPATLFFCFKGFRSGPQHTGCLGQVDGRPDGVTLGLPPTCAQHVLPGCSALRNGRSKQKPYKFRSQGFVSVPWVKANR